jgi:hypothetical protein
MLPPIEPDEQLVAHGLYQQVRQDKPTKLQESWSVHSLPDQAMIWRSQLVYDGVLPISACYLLRDPAFQPMQMVFYWRWPDGREELIEYRFSPQHVTILYGGQAQDMILPVGSQVYGWHTIMENLLWLGYDRQRGGSQTIRILAPGIHQGTLWPSFMTMEATFDRTEIMPGPGGPYKAAAFVAEMPGIGLQHLYFDEFGVPLRWVLHDEQLRVELTEYRRTR